MIKKYICEICGAEISSAEAYPVKFEGLKFHICTQCSARLDDLKYKKYKQEGIIYLREMIDQGRCTEQGKSYIRFCFEKNNAYDELAYTAPIEETKLAARAAELKKASASDGSGLLLSGICFLVLAAILYFTSTRDVDGLKIANIQTTVFCAASFIVSICCFACRSVITAVHEKMDIQTKTIQAEIEKYLQASKDDELTGSEAGE